MNHKILFICLFAVLVFNSVLAVPTLTSVSVSPNPVKLGQNLSVSTVSSDANNYMVDSLAHVLGINNQGGAYQCVVFKPNNSGYLNTFNFTIYNATYGADWNTARIFVKNGTSLVYGGLVAETTNKSAGNTYDATCGDVRFTFPTNTYFLNADQNYFACVSHAGSSSSCAINTADGSHVYCEGGATEGGSCSALARKHPFDINFNITKSLRIKAISTGGNYDTNYLFSGAYSSTNPTGSFLNPFSENYTLSVKTQNIDGLYSSEINTTVYVTKPETKYLTVTGIENLARWEYGSIILYPSNENNQIIFKVDSNSLASEYPNFIVRNTLRDGKQYFIYTSSDGETWVFNDSLTFSDSIYGKPIQKIWDSINGVYEYSFIDTLNPLETKYYKLTYSSPAMYWGTQNADWFKQLTPTQNDLNGFVYDQVTISTYANLSNYPIKPLSQLIGNQNINYEFQFTAFTSDLNANVLVYLKDVNGSEYLIETVNVDTNKARFSISLNPNSFNQYIELKTNNVYPVTINFVDYAIVPRGYFVAPLNIYSPDGSDLPLIVSNENYFQYVKENGGFLAQTSINDRAGDLNLLVVTAHFDVNSDSNGAKKYYIPLSGTGNQTLTQSLDGLVDLTDTATNVIVKFTLYNKNGLIVSEQTKTVKFLQFPYFPSDLVLAINDSAQLIGESPKGRITLVSPNPENILGLEFYIYNDTNTPANPNYYTVLYKDIDFSCLANDCSFNYELNDFAFSKDSNKWFITVQVLLNTRNKTTPTKNQENVFYVTSITKIINFLALKTARVVQTFERQDDITGLNNNQYHNTESIGLTVEVVNALHDDIRKSAGISLYLVDCGDDSQATNCKSLASSYTVAPLSTAYDPQTGTNYFIFKNVFLMQNDLLLKDGNYFRVVATIFDKSGQYSTSNKNIFLGLKSGGNIVDSTTGEILLRINNAKTLTAPIYELLTCAKLDYSEYPKPNNIEFECIIYYSILNESPDKFTFRLANENSDFTEQVAGYKQYFDLEIPYSLIAINDNSVLTNEQYVKSLDCPLGLDLPLCQIGALYDWATNPICYANHFNPEECRAVLLGDFNRFFKSSIGSDSNFSHWSDESYTSGMFRIKITNPNIINMVDYYGVNSEIENINPKYFIRYANTNNIVLPSLTTKTEIFGSMVTPYVSYESNNYLVINETPKENYVDSNGVNQTAPTILNFDLSSNLVYGGGINSIYRYVQLSYATAITQQGQFLNDIVNGAGEFVSNPVDFTFKHIWIISIALMLIFIVGFIVRTWSGG